MSNSDLIKSAEERIKTVNINELKEEGLLCLDGQFLGLMAGYWP